jgi:hypothetical protein
MKRRAAATLALTAGLAGAGIATASSAAAYGPANAVVCFVVGDGAPYTGPVFAQVAAPGGWQNVASSASYNGCTQWTLASGATWRFEAMATAYRTVFEGTTAPMAMPAPGAYNFGTWVVAESHF